MDCGDNNLIEPNVQGINEVKFTIMEHKVKWTEEEFKVNYTKEWEQSVEITYWEHDFENGWYIIKYKKR